MNLSEIKEVVFEGWAGAPLMKADPQFNINPESADSDDLWASSRGTYIGLPCRLGEVENIPERDRTKILTLKNLEELGIKYPQGKVFYLEGDILYVRGSQEVNDMLGF